LADEDFEVHVYAEHWDEEHPKIHFHKVKTFPFPKSLRLLSFAVRATKAIEDENYDITFGVGNTLKADILQPHGGVHWAWFWRSLRAYDHSFIWTIKLLGRIFSPKQWVGGWIEDAPYRMKPHPRFIAISDMVKQDMMRWYKIPEAQIHVIYNGVDIERFHPRQRLFREEIRKHHGIGDERVILFVSNNFRMKGLMSLIKALVKIKEADHPPFKLLILGRGRQNPYLRLAKKMKVNEEVIFAGSTSEPEKYYGASDLLVHPTFYDACSLTVLEALASGLPVITSYSNGASGIITQGEEGSAILDPRQDQILAEKISFFLDRERLEKASIAARHLAESFSLEKNWEGMENIFQKNFIKGVIPE
jgi:UDP-glucose:(heptosyl)LPS alpha-1,3-glucosyltransferase